MNDTPVRRMPAVFFGHGSPMNGIENNAYTQAWEQFARAVPRPRAILAVSAHWDVPGTKVTAMPRPPTIHDFGGFPKALSDLEYPAPGDPALAERVRDLLAPEPVALDRSWGLDHGTWSVLAHAYPQADVPVVQLSIDSMQPAHVHYERAKRLRALRDEGVLVMSSGNVVHNLGFRFRESPETPYDWAVRFNERTRAALANGDHRSLVAYEQAGDDARLAVPEPEHYLPLLYTAAQQEDGDTVAFLTDGYEFGGCITMLSVAVGA